MGIHVVQQNIGWEKKDFGHFADVKAKLSCFGLGRLCHITIHCTKMKLPVGDRRKRQLLFCLGEF